MLVPGGRSGAEGYGGHFTFGLQELAGRGAWFDPLKSALLCHDGCECERSSGVEARYLVFLFPM